MLDRILVPLDGSPLSECTLAHALKLARAFGARVHLFWVTEPEPEGNQDQEAEWLATRARAQSYLCRVSPLFQEFGVPVDTQVLAGTPAECTLELARSVEADLILLSTHRSTGLTEFPLSGTASKVLAAAADSVMVVRSREEGTAPTEEPYERVLAAVDLTEHSLHAAQLSAKLARSEGSELLLVAVVQVPEVLGDDPDRDRTRLANRLAALNRHSAEAYLEALARELKDADGKLRVRTLLVEDHDVARALGRVAAREDASLLVLGARGSSSDPEHRHGAVAARLLEQIDRPVFVYRNRPTGASATATTELRVA